ncbi:glycosyltransferase family A protein [Pedobacter sp.]|uniref:glycosyltransferase family A protein n=1 Tax=Pedobacter sp. TaxID=1411316 RepID=UPI003C43ABB3
MAEAEHFIRLMSNLGYKEGLFSLGTKYTYTRNQISFIIRMNPNFGDFFQIKKTIEGEDLPSDVKLTLSNFLKKLDLGHWSDEDYRRHIKEVWKDKEKEPLLDEEFNLNKKIRDILIQYQYSVQNTHFIEDESVSDILKRTSNDYSDLESAFYKITAHDLVSTDLIDFSNSFSINASIIIPYYNNLPFLLKCLRSIALQNLAPSQFKSIEVIIVDDGSDNTESEFILRNVIDELDSKGVPVQFIRMSKNQGRSIARNLGASAANNEVLIFLDADVLIDTNFVKETLVRHQYLDNILLVGFKQNLVYDTELQVKEVVSAAPAYEEDFRMKVRTKKDWDGLYPVLEERETRCFQETEGFKSFGSGKVIGAFDLPCMVVTSNVSVKKKYFQLIGGFNRKFSSNWGYEDTFFGACMIAAGNFVVPIISSGIYHLVTENERLSGIRAEKKIQLKDNFAVYRGLINQKGYLKSQNKT